MKYPHINENTKIYNILHLNLIMQIVSYFQKSFVYIHEMK